MRERLIELIVDAENAIYQEKPYTTDNERIGKIADRLLTDGVIVLPCLREWNSDGLWCGYELLYDDKGTFTVIHFGNSQKEDAIEIFEEIKAEKALAELNKEGEDEQKVC